MAKTSRTTTDSRILPCKCNHPAQDRFYVNGRRLHTWGEKRHGRGPGFVCTVCTNFKPGRVD